MIRVLSFDLDGTLVDRDAAHRRYLQDLGARRPDVFRRPEDALTLASSDLRIFARRATRAFPSLGSVGEIAGDHARNIARFVVPEPGVLDMLARLRAEYTLVLASNGSGAVQRAKLDAAGLADSFHHVLISGEIGVRKPSREFFDRIAGATETVPGSILHIGDDLARDVAGAVRAGLEACWVGGRCEAPFRGRSRPGRIISRIGDLPRALP